MVHRHCCAWQAGGVRIRLRKRHLAALVALLLVAGVTGALLVIRRGGEPELPPPVPVATAYRAAPLDITKVTVVGGRPGTRPRTLGSGLRRELAAAIERHLQAAVDEPLLSGKRARAYEKTFTATARPRARHDRGVLTDEALAPATAVARRGATAELTVLVGPDGKPAIVSAEVRLRLAVIAPRATAADRATEGFEVDRRATLVLVPERGEWRVEAYDVVVRTQRTRALPLDAFLWPFPDLTTDRNDAAR